MDAYANQNMYYNAGPQYNYDTAHQPQPTNALPHSSMTNSLNYEELFDPFSTPPPQKVLTIALTPVTQLAPGHPYATSSKLAPVSFREPTGRDSAYSPSIDSFYGAPDASGKAQ